ncbi:hypothetical protein NKH77_03575 [Streptomyces sp. M19]
MTDSTEAASVRAPRSSSGSAARTPSPPSSRSSTRGCWPIRIWPGTSPVWI